MNGKTTWEEETEARFREAREKAENLAVELDYWTKRRDLLGQLLELESRRRAIAVDEKGGGIDPVKLRSGSIREALIEIASRNNGLLVVREATPVLVQAGVYSDRTQANNGIYSTLGQSKSYFKKQRPGIYGLTSKAQGQLTLVS